MKRDEVMLLVDYLYSLHEGLHKCLMPQMPRTAQAHFRVMKKEGLLGIRSLLDVVIDHVAVKDEGRPARVADAANAAIETTTVNASTSINSENVLAYAVDAVDAVDAVSTVSTVSTVRTMNALTTNEASAFHRDGLNEVDTRSKRSSSIIEITD